MENEFDIHYQFERIDDKHLDSFWYNGLIASIRFENKVISVFAQGEIRWWDSATNEIGRASCRERV